MNGIKAIFFDYGGVIAGEAFTVTQRNGEYFPVDPALASVAEILQTPYDQLWREVGGDITKMLAGKQQGSGIELLLKGKISEEVVWNSYAQKHHLPLPSSAHQLLAVNYPQIYPENKEMLNFVSTLRTPQRKIGLLSNTVESQARFNEQQNRYALFEPVVLSCRIGYKKPEPEIYESACTLVGLSSNECLFIDDTQKNLEGAEKVGMRTLLFRNGIDKVAWLRKKINKKGY